MLDLSRLPGNVIALDVGGSSIKSGIVAPGGELVHGPTSTAIHSQGSRDDVLATFEAVIRMHLHVCAPDMPAAVGVGFPGPFDYAKGICLIRGVQKYDHIYGLDLRKAFSHWLPPAMPILFRNDAEAAIVGEAVHGAGRSYQRLIGITLGTGLGSAFLDNGEPQRNAPGVPPNGELYGVPHEGAIADETFSVRGLTARVRTVAPSVADLQDAATRAESGDAASATAFAAFGADLAKFMQPWIASFRGDALIVLGGIAAASRLFVPAMRAHMRVPVFAGTLGQRAALLGAAALCVRQHR